MSAYDKTRIIRREQPMNSTALAIDLGYTDYIDRIGEAVLRAAGRASGGLKEVARAANTNVRTLENLTQKVTGPNGLTLLKLMATVPEVQAEVRRVAGMEANLDPNFERDLNALFRTYNKLQSAKRE